tara:strand:+ start:224 stop:514 length:291 start_codon:yes stop_codon:yes gene_type:complete
MAKADLEMAVLKAQCCSPLSTTEMLELLDVDQGRLIREFDLDLVQSQQVMTWRKHEALRWGHQLISYPEPLAESKRSRRHSKKLSIKGLNKIIRES